MLLLDPVYKFLSHPKESKLRSTQITTFQLSTISIKWVILTGQSPGHRKMCEEWPLNLFVKDSFSGFMVTFHPFTLEELEEEPENDVVWCDLWGSPELPQGQHYGLSKQNSKFLKASGQMRHWRNSPKLCGAGVLRMLILLASWRGSHGAQWHPDLHQLGSLVPPLQAPGLGGKPPFPRDPRNVVLSISPYAVFHLTTCRNPHCHGLWCEETPQQCVTLIMYSCQTISDHSLRPSGHFIII